MTDPNVQNNLNSNNDHINPPTNPTLLVDQTSLTKEDKIKPNIGFLSYYFYIFKIEKKSKRN